MKRKLNFYFFYKDGARDIQVGPVCVQESKSAVLLEMTINKKLDWFDHVATLEKELKQRTGVLFRLRNYIPQHALLGLLSGFFNSKASYMMDIFTDPTGHE
jgi:hypothetical protein